MSEPASPESTQAQEVQITLADDPLVRQLRPDPSAPPQETVILAGYLGRDTDSGYWRVYQSARLDSYLRVSESDILARDQGQDAAGREVSHLVLRANAAVETVRSMTAGQASFLLGSYTSSMIGSAASSRPPKFGAKRLPRTSAEDLVYPNTGYPYICPVYITIEYQTCFCTIFCPSTPVICPQTLPE